MSEDRTASRKISDIQVLRGISILSVLFYHLSLTPTVLGKFPKQITMPFYLGVELFFIISGYVVTMSLVKDQFNGLKFLVKRAFRLLPAIVMVLIFSYLVLEYIRHNSRIPESLKPIFVVDQAIFFKQAWGILGGYLLLLPQQHVYTNGAVWSLSVEDQFYAGIALVSIIAVASNRLTRIPAKAVVAATSAALFVVLFRMRLLVLASGPDAIAEFPQTLRYLLHWKFDFLPLGVLLALFDLRFPGRSARFFANRGPALTGWLLLIPLFAASLCEDPHLATSRFLMGFVFPVTAICFGILVLSAGNQCAFPCSRGRLYRFFEWLGNRSFTYYLFQFPCLAAVWTIIFQVFPWGMSGPFRYGFTQLVFSTLFMVPLVELVYRLVEMPMTRLGKRLVDRRHPVLVVQPGEQKAKLPEAIAA